MKKLFTVVLLGTMVSLAARESKKADTTSGDTTTTMMADTSAMGAAMDTTMGMDTMSADTAR